MKSIALALFALTSVAVADYIVINKQLPITTRERIQVQLESGDAFRIEQQDKERVLIDIPGVTKAAVRIQDGTIVPINMEVAEHSNLAITRIQRAYSIQIPPGDRWWRDRRGFEFMVMQDQAPSDELERMDKIQTLGLYAVAVKVVRLNGMTIEIGDAFPLLGVQGETIRLKFGPAMIPAPAASFNVVKGADNPDAMASYSTLLSAYVKVLDAREQRRIAQEQQRTLDRISRQLDGQQMTLDMMWMQQMNKPSLPPAGGPPR